MEEGKEHSEHLAPGRYLVYHRGASGGTWRARCYDSATREKFRTSIGAADDEQESDGLKILDYEQAKAKAQSWCKSIENLDTEALPTGPVTVADCLDAYMKDAERRGVKGIKIMQSNIEAHIRPALGAALAERLSLKRLQDWHQKLAETARRRTGKKRDEPEHLEVPATEDEKRARKDTANRILTILKAALNYAHEKRMINGATPWRDCSPFQKVAVSRIRTLTTTQQTKLAKACSEDFRPLVIAALATGARYGEICRLNVRDFNAKAGTLFIEFSKGGQSRHVHLAAEAVKWFQGIVKGRKPQEPMFKFVGVRTKRESNGRWQDYDQVHAMQEATNAAKLSISFHELRHTFASELINKGMPLSFVAEQLGHADTRMVERYYGHLAKEALKKAVRQYTPKKGKLFA